MGVPKFYRWISERYPKINQIITSPTLLPEFDHLYLDMNGILHGCTHPSHMDVSTTLTEKEMILGIFHYIDRIVSQIVKPKVSVYMAIDGCAPRAKLNQQRSRRFRSAKDLSEVKKKKAECEVFTKDDSDYRAGEESELFDSNCITPGTPFMANISTAIKFFIRKKLKTDPLWRDLTILFSGHECPGEGEHKIMSHIRSLRNSEGYRPNARHCMYGQDADLIMLGLVTHEPHFTLLREVVEFFIPNDKTKGFSNSKTVKKFTKESDFQLLHLSILREYLEIEFCSDKAELERCIDDFVFLTFLVGNDFLPHMPSLDIGDGAFDLLFRTYKEFRAGAWSGQFLTLKGEIVCPKRLEEYLKCIGSEENDILVQKEDDEAVYRKKKRRWDARDGKACSIPSEGEIALKETSLQQDYDLMVEKVLQSGKKCVDGWSFTGEEKDFKGRYYYEKLDLKPVDVEGHVSLRTAYIEGLVWCLAYYYKGCISWGWYYPYHYGPMLSDLVHLPDIFDKIHFDLGAPLKPFEQLMGCLPPASKTLVPKPYRKLMTSLDSPILPFYPLDFLIDMNGKKNPWEGVNLLPFIDIPLLKSTIQKFCPDTLLSAEERGRNALGTVLVYQHDWSCQDTINSFNTDIVPNIPECHSRIISNLEADLKPGDSFQPELIPGTRLPLPGFPSLQVLPLENPEFIPIGLNCFGMKSKYPTMVLSLHKIPTLPKVSDLAHNLLDTSVFCNWPMMHEAKVIAISDSHQEISTKHAKPFTADESDKWIARSIQTEQDYLRGTGTPGNGGIQIGPIQIRLKVVPLQGMKINPLDGSSKKVWGSTVADIPIQMALFRSPCPDDRFVEHGPLKLQDRFPAKSRVVLTRGKYRGCSGETLGISQDKVGVCISVRPEEPPFGYAIAKALSERYVSGTEAAKLLRINPGIFNKVTGSLFVEPGRFDLGLGLKVQNKYCVNGYTRKIAKQKKKKKATAWEAGDALKVIGTVGAAEDEADSPGSWEYSPHAIRLVGLYRQTFPLLFQSLSKLPFKDRNYHANALFGYNKNNQNAEQLQTIRNWLDKAPTAKIPRMPTDTECMTPEGILAVQRASDVRLSQNGAVAKQINIRVPASALYREGSTKPTELPPSISSTDMPHLGDRVVSLCANGVPFGHMGTVVGVHSGKNLGGGCVEVVFDEEFIGGASLQGACAKFRGKLCVWGHLLRVSARDAVVSATEGMNGEEYLTAILGKEEKKSKDDKAPILLKKVPVSGATDTPVKQSTNKQLSVKTTPLKMGSSERQPMKLTSKKQAKQTKLWQESVGPPLLGNKRGFAKGSRGTSSGGGYQKWKNILSSRKSNINDEAPNLESKTENLKALLGIMSIEDSPGKPEEQMPSLETNVVKPALPPSPVDTADPSFSLKSLLGMNKEIISNVNPLFPPPPPPMSSESDGLKSILGMNRPLPPPPPPPHCFIPPPPPQYNQVNPKAIPFWVPPPNNGFPMQPVPNNGFPMRPVPNNGFPMQPPPNYNPVIPRSKKNLSNSKIVPSAVLVPKKKNGGAEKK